MLPMPAPVAPLPFPSPNQARAEVVVPALPEVLPAPPAEMAEDQLPMLEAQVDEPEPIPDQARAEVVVPALPEVLPVPPAEDPLLNLDVEVDELNLDVEVDEPNQDRAVVVVPALPEEIDEPVAPVINRDGILAIVQEPEAVLPEEGGDLEELRTIQERTRTGSNIRLPQNLRDYVREVRSSFSELFC